MHFPSAHGLKKHHAAEWLHPGLGKIIPENIKEKIMQPFFTTKPTGQGTGLGLLLSYDIIVKGHGGNITINSVEGEGSEFTIALPIS